ncbi:MAG TPA: hypothetical protein VFK68_11860 [Propionibacteriaceae bacterium]|nr:hypothetical protein [Propionibacteriaceae bacterium]
MGLFRDRTGTPRWSLFSPRPQPRRAKGLNSPDSPATPSEPLDEPAAEVTDDQATNVAAAATRPPVPDHEPKPWERYPGLPALSAAEARARNGRGFAAIIMPRHRRSTRREQAGRRVHVDVNAAQSALDSAAASLGQGLVQAVVWDPGTGLALAGHGDDAARVAPVWHRVLRDVRRALPQAGFPAAGSPHLVGLESGRLAILLHVPAGPGACLTVQTELVALDDVLESVVPALRHALISASGGH